MAHVDRHRTLGVVIRHLLLLLLLGLRLRRLLLLQQPLLLPRGHDGVHLHDVVLPVRDALLVEVERTVEVLGQDENDDGVERGGEEGDVVGGEVEVEAEVVKDEGVRVSGVAEGSEPPGTPAVLTVVGGGCGVV